MARVIELFVDQFLAIDQGFPTSNPQGQAVYQTISFTDAAKNYRTVLDVGHILNFGQAVNVRRSIFHIAVSDYLPFYQKGGNGPDVQVLTQFFYMGHEVKLNEYEIISQTLTITQAVVVDRTRACVDTFEMTDSVTYTIERTIHVTQTFYIGSSGNGYLLREDTYSVPLPTITGTNAPEC